MHGALTDTLARLTERGATVERRDPPYGSATLTFVPRYLAGVAEDAAHYVPSRAMLEPRTRHVAMLGRLFSARRIAQSKALAQRLRATLDEVYADIDVLLMPTIARPAVRAGTWTHRGLVATARGVSTWVPFCAIWNGLAMPAVSVPVGLSADGLPLAVQVVGSDETMLLRVAALIEEASGPRPQPRL
jgi:amidase